MGLLIVPALVVYIAVSLGLTVWAAIYAKKRGKNPWLWAFGVAFVMYNLVFWDWLPTVAVHKYYCSTEAGFWVYKTPEEWREENSEELKISKFINNELSTQSKNGVAVQTYAVNKQVVWQRNISRELLNVRRYEDILIDTKTKKILAKRTFFESGKCFGATKKLSDLKFWLNICGCSEEKDSHYSSKISWSNVYSKFKTMGEDGCQ